MDHRPDCWGVSSGIDLYDCDLTLMQDQDEAANLAARFLKAGRCRVQVVRRSCPGVGRWLASRRGPSCESFSKARTDRS